MRPHAVTALAVALAISSATACSSSPSAGRQPNGGGSSTSPSAVAYAGCMRSHGVASYPDPTSGGNLPKGGAEAFGVSTTVFAAAQLTCQHLLPATGGSFIAQFQQCVSGGVCPPSLVQEALTTQRAFAQCMRSHGVPNFPDPRIGRNGAPYFPASDAGLSRADTHSAEFRSKEEQCQGVAGGSVPVLMG
jgi:hypothetical protein